MQHCQQLSPLILLVLALGAACTRTPDTGGIGADASASFDIAAMDTSTDALCGPDGEPCSDSTAALADAPTAVDASKDAGADNGLPEGCTGPYFDAIGGPTPCGFTCPWFGNCFDCPGFDDCVATNETCWASNICIVAALCGAVDGNCECTAGKLGSCEAGACCKYRGLCKAGPKGQCLPLDTPSCKASTRCATMGMCALSPDGKRCEPGTSADCSNSLACQTLGWCSVVASQSGTGKLCNPTSMADCEQSEGCKLSGNCTPVGKLGAQLCAGTTQDCAASAGCAKSGLCGYDASWGECTPMEAADCEQSADCKNHGACILKQSILRRCLRPDQLFHQ